MLGGCGWLSIRIVLVFVIVKQGSLLVGLGLLCGDDWIAGRLGSATSTGLVVVLVVVKEGLFLISHANTL